MVRGMCRKPSPPRQFPGDDGDAGHDAQIQEPTEPLTTLGRELTIPDAVARWSGKRARKHAPAFPAIKPREAETTNMSATTGRGRYQHAS